MSAGLLRSKFAPALSLSTSGAIKLAGNTVAGSATAVVNTQFNNWLYGETTPLWQAGLLGSGAGLFAPIAGLYMQDVATSLLPNVPCIPMSGPVKPIAAQGPLDQLPAQIGAGVNLGGGASPAFVDPTWLFTPANPLPNVPTPLPKPSLERKP